MIEILRADITTLEVDTIVNAANRALAGGGGVDGAIHKAAGPRLLAASRALAPCPAGDAVITPGFDLPAKYVIHAVGPIWRGGSAGEPELLGRAYHRCFDLAAEQGDIRSIAFPAISTGVYAFPKDEAAKIALAVMREREPEVERVIACVYDHESLHIYQNIAARSG